MRLSSLVVALVLALSGTGALAQPKAKQQGEPPRAAPAEREAPQSLTGTWVGTYRCAQGLTGLTLTIDEAGPERARATFLFYPERSNPAVPSGCFAMTGRYDAASRRLTLSGGRWIVRPRGYVAVGLAGTVDAGAGVIAGRVTEAEGCTSFRLERRAHPEDAPWCGVSASLR